MLWLADSIHLRASWRQSCSDAKQTTRQNGPCSRKSKRLSAKTPYISTWPRFTIRYTGHTPDGWYVLLAAVRRWASLRPGWSIASYESDALVVWKYDMSLTEGAKVPTGDLRTRARYANSTCPAQRRGSHVLYSQKARSAAETWYIM
jgi:hypothetical protein